MTSSPLSSALRRTAARSLRRDVAALGGSRPWIRAAAAASSRFFCSAQEAVEPSGTPEGDGEFPGTSGRDGADALAATGTLLADLEDHDDARDLAASDDGHLDDANHDAGDREPFARRHRTRRQKLVIVGEAEARARRRPPADAVQDPGMEGIRVALLAMEARRRQLYNPFSFVEQSADPRTRELENRQRRNEILAVDNEVTRYKEGQMATAARGDGSSLPIGRRLLQGFYDPLTKAIELEQEAVRLKVPGVDRSNYGPFLLMLNADKLSVITLHTVISQLMKGDEAFSPDTPQAGMCKSSAWWSAWARRCRRR